MTSPRRPISRSHVLSRALVVLAAIFYGFKPVITAIVASATIQIGRRAL